MRKQTFQHAEIRDENDNIISNGAYGKNTALSNKQNDGWVDYVMNNLERLQESIEYNAKSNDSTNQKLTDYAKTTEVDNKLTNYAKKESLIGLASTEYVDGRIQHVVGTAPEALDTLGEIATALTGNKDKIGTIINEISTKADRGTVENALMGKAEKADVYTKSESDERYQAKGDYATNKRIKAMIDILYPIGIIITTATDNTPKPGEEYGLAQWKQVGAGRSLIGAGTGTDKNGKSMTFSIGQQGGEYEHKLTIDELPTHDHAECINGNGQDGWNNSYGAMVSLPVNGGGTTQGYSANVTGMWNSGGNQVKTKATGGNHAHNNIQPYLVAYFWKRIK